MRFRPEKGDELPVGSEDGEKFGKRGSFWKKRAAGMNRPLTIQSSHGLQTGTELRGIHEGEDNRIFAPSVLKVIAEEGESRPVAVPMEEFDVVTVDERFLGFQTADQIADDGATCLARRELVAVEQRVSRVNGPTK